MLDCRANKRQSFFDNVEFGKVYLETASCSLCVQVNRTLNTWMSVKTNCKKIGGGGRLLLLFSFPKGNNQAKSKVPARAKRQELFQKHYQNLYSEHLQVAHSCKERLLDRDICFIRQKVDSPLRKDCNTRMLHYHKQLKLGKRWKVKYRMFLSFYYW